MMQALRFFLNWLMVFTAPIWAGTIFAIMLVIEGTRKKQKWMTGKAWWF